MDQYCHVAPLVANFFNNTGLTQPFLVGFDGLKDKIDIVNKKISLASK